MRVNSRKLLFMPQSLNRSIELYYSEIGRTNPIKDINEERRLIFNWQKYKDTSARDALLQSHLRFVVTMARRRTKNPEQLEDIIASGNLGLVKALDRYDLSRRPAVRFLTYAGAWINKEMLDNDYTTSSLVRIPTHRQKAQRKQAKAFRKVLLEFGPDSTEVHNCPDSIPEGRTVDLEDIREVIENRRYFIRDGNRTAARNITDNDLLRMSHSMYEFTHTDQILRDTIQQLPVREQTVLNLYYGIKDEPRNLVQIAALLEISPERIRQIKISGVKLLKELLVSQHAVAAPTDAY